MNVAVEEFGNEIRNVGDLAQSYRRRRRNRVIEAHRGFGNLGNLAEIFVREFHHVGYTLVVWLAVSVEP